MELLSEVWVWWRGWEMLFLMLFPPSSPPPPPPQFPSTVPGKVGLPDQFLKPPPTSCCKAAPLSDYTITIEHDWCHLSVEESLQGCIKSKRGQCVLSDHKKYLFWVQKVTLHYRQATDFRSNTCEQKFNLMPDSTAVLAGSSSFLETIHITRVDKKTKKKHWREVSTIFMS